MAAATETRFMRRDCINAVNAFIEKVNALPYASVETDATYYSDRNKFTKQNGKKAKTGARLGIVLGGGDRDRTCYAFHMRNLADPDNRRPVSLRYTPDDGKPAIIAARSMPDAGPRQADALDSSELTYNMARMMNSISFGPMFDNWGPTVRADTAEERALKAVTAAEKENGWNDVAGMLDSPDPLKAMEAWAWISQARDGKVNPNAPGVTRGASMAMGLDALYGCLEEINGKIAADPDYVPDLSEYLDPDTDMGRRAMRGLACMSAWKEAKDHGGVYGKDREDNVVIGINMDDNNMRAVYDSLAFVRPRAEIKWQEAEGAEQVRRGLVAMNCVQATFAGIAPGSDKGADFSASNSTKYRLYRAAVLGEDPDMRSGAPVFNLSLRKGVDPKSIEKLSANDIIVQSSSLGTGSDLQPFGTFLEKAMTDPSGQEAGFLANFPAIQDMMSMAGGNTALENMAVKQMQNAKGGPIDGLAMEIELFTRKDGTKNVDAMARLMSKPGPDGRTGKDLLEAFEKNFHAHHDETPQFSRSLDDARAFPSFAEGVDKFGYCVLSDLEGAGVLEYQAGAAKGNSNEAKTARAFRRSDQERGAAATRFIMLDGNGVGPESMTDIRNAMGGRDATGAFNQFIRACQKVGTSDDPQQQVLSAMMMNDMIVMSDCYGLRDQTSLEKLGQDIWSVYSGNVPERSLYRPKNRGEAKALRDIYAKTDADPANAFVAPRFQGIPEGFQLAVWNGVGDNGSLKAKVISGMKARALDSDTLTDTTYHDLAARLEEPVRSEKAMGMMLDEQRDAGREPAGHGGVDGVSK